MRINVCQQLITTAQMKTKEKGKMVVDMELQEAKDEVLRLMKDKDKIEYDIRALKDVLDSVCIIKHIILYNKPQR